MEQPQRGQTHQEANRIPASASNREELGPGLLSAVVLLTATRAAAWSMLELISWFLYTMMSEPRCVLKPATSADVARTGAGMWHARALPSGPKAGGK